MTVAVLNYDEAALKGEEYYFEMPIIRKRDELFGSLPSQKILITSKRPSPQLKCVGLHAPRT